MTTETKAHECADAVRWTECGGCTNGVIGSDEGTNHYHESCNGTGLRFPGLSRECKNYWHRGGIPTLKLPTVCPTCQGRDRVSKDGLEAWLDAAESIVPNEFPDLLMTYAPEGFELTLSWFDLAGHAIAPTRLAAVSQALCRAIEIHKEQS